VILLAVAYDSICSVFTTKAGVYKTTSYQLSVLIKKAEVISESP